MADVLSVLGHGLRIMKIVLVDGTYVLLIKLRDAFFPESVDVSQLSLKRNRCFGVIEVYCLDHLRIELFN